MPETSNDEQRAVPTLFRLLRERSGLRQSDLAERVGVPQSTISKIETGERRLELLEARVLCQAMGATLTEFAELIERELAKATRS